MKATTMSMNLDNMFDILTNATEETYCLMETSNKNFILKPIYAMTIYEVKNFIYELNDKAIVIKIER